MKTVSVIIPAYNTESYIDECLDSVLEQTYAQLEIIVINDGSPDNLEKIVEKYEKNEKRVRLISQPNKGLSEARNKGIEVSTGDYILFLDSDDWLEQDAIEKLIEKIWKEKTQIVMPDRFTEINMEGKANEKLLFTDYDQYPTPADFVVNIVIAQAKAWRATSVLYENNLIKEHNLKFPEGYTAEDVIFNLKYLSKVDSMSFLKYPTLNVNRREGSITDGYREELLKVFLFIDKNSRKFINEVNYDPVKGQIAVDSLLCRNIILWINSEMSKENKKILSEKIGRIYGVLKTERVREAFQQEKFMKPYWNERIRIKYVMFMRFLIKHSLYPFVILQAMYSNKVGLFDNK